METGLGQLFVLAEVPSRGEMEIAKGGDFLRALEATYLPREWGNRQALDNPTAIENLLIYLRKAESDIYFDMLGEQDGHCIHAGILLDNGTFQGVRGLKFCTDLSSANEDKLNQGDVVRATVGIDERSLQFNLTFLGHTTHALANGAELPCAFFAPPENVTISQRRLSFRIPVVSDIPVVLHSDASANDASPWGDREVAAETLFHGTLADLSFSGARITTVQATGCMNLEIDRRVICEIDFPDMAEPLSVLGVIRRTSSRLVDRNNRQYEVGLEFVIFGDTDRTALEQIRQFVLAEQRSRLAKRIHVGGISA